MIYRLINPIKSNSFLLFGARGTGKSTFLRQFFQKEKTLWIDLLDPLQEDALARQPAEFFRRVEAEKRRVEWVVIDEIQKVPRLLDSVHRLIESTALKFAMTGSSARKLKRGAGNLLAGRAFINHLYPLVRSEMGERFDLMATLQWGALPRLTHLNSEEEKREYLRAYALTYLKEEIWGEQIVRNLDPFRRFLPIAAQCSGEILNFTKISRDVGVDVKTVQSYFEILEDTLVGVLLPPYHRSIRKQQRQSPKFYFFDLGVKRALDGSIVQPPVPNTFGFGRLFEHFVFLEMLRLNDYHKKDFRFSYLLTKDRVEVDLIIERPGLGTCLVEIKSSESIVEQDVKNLRHFLPDFPKGEAYCLSRDPFPKKFENIWALPWEQGIQELGLG
ncbi:MAG: ATP-binding protein [Deltaproteobacteria bacterium]|nr:ATP-binding protein [Deltaproteobacteria bacterium]